MDASALPSRTPTLHDHEEHIRSEIDVEQAERAFHRLERVTTSESRKEIQRHKSEHSVGKKGIDEEDLEKAVVADGEEPFDLREYLSSANDKANQHGLKHKHVGVTWEDLQVDVVGGMDHKVSSPNFSEPKNLNSNEHAQFYVRTFGRKFPFNPKEKQYGMLKPPNRGPPRIRPPPLYLVHVSLRSLNPFKTERNADTYRSPQVRDFGLLFSFPYLILMLIHLILFS